MLRLMNKALLAGGLCLFLVCSKESRAPAAEIDPTLQLLAKAGTYLPENSTLELADSSIELDFKQLIAKGAKVDSADADSNSALLLLAGTADARFFPKVRSLADILLENNSDVNRKNSRQLTALHLACMNGNRELVERLIARGADVNALDQSSCSPVVYAVLGGDRVEIVDLLMRHKADLSWKDPTDSMSLLEIAERRNFTRTAQLLKTVSKSK